MKCNLQIDKNGELKVGGVNAPLFREAMLRTNQNEEASLKIWAVAESDGFKGFNVPPTYDNVIKYNEYRERIDSTPFSSTELSDSMNASIGNVFFQEDFMKSFTNEKGEFEISSDRLKKVGLYSSSEIYNLLSNENIQRNVKKFYNKSLNFESPITTSEAKYVVKSDNEISSLGFFKRENPDVVNETLGNIFAGVKSKEDFDNRKMKVDEQWEAVKYEDISSDFSDKTSIAQYVENPLTNELELKSYNNTYYETLFGTEIGENNEKAVEIIDLITSLTPEQLSDTNEIKHAFNTLSKELVKSGIDFVGIENQYGEIPSPKIIELLLHTKNILTNEAISEEGLQNYVDVYNEVFEKNQNTKKSLFDGIITNSMKIEKENISDASLFINNSLVKIKENVYKKINRNYEDVYEAVYNLMKNGGKQVIPFDVSKAERALYKEKVIRELREFASKKSQGIKNDVEATNEELNEMSLLSEYFKEEEQIVNPKVEWIKFERLSKIKDVESWKSRFVQRMNKEMISQKMKGNMLPLTITQRGLEMKTGGDYSLSLIKNSISNPLYSDLIDYGFLTNQDFLATEEGIFIDEGNVDFQRNLYANNPNLISEYNGAVEYGQGTDLKAVGDTFIKVGGIVYEKVNGNVYGLVSNQGEQTWNRQIPKISTKPSENKVLGNKTIKQTTNFNVNVEERNPNTNEIENIEIKYEVTQQLQKTGLAKNVHTLSPQQIEQELIKRGVDSNVAKQVSAWHGSPHLFNKFSTSAMGTGEGAQAFGWGLYFTDLEDIGRHYASASSDTSKEHIKYIDDFIFLGEELTPSKEFINILLYERGFSQYLNENDLVTVKELLENSNINNVIDFLIEKEVFYSKPNFLELTGDLVDSILSLEKELNKDELINFLETTNYYNKESLEIFKNKLYALKEPNVDTFRNLYNVTLHKGKTPDQYTWLEWDITIDKKIIGDRFVDKLTDKQIDIVVGHLGVKNQSGEMLYEGLSKALGSPKAASLFLLENGIDGIRYPAESLSRGATSDTARGFNYVVFDENAVTIEEVIQFQKEGLGLLPNGFVDLNTKEVFLNQETANLDTPIHEFSHLFTDMLKQTNPQLYKRGLELIEKEGKEYIDFVKKNQPNLKGEALLDEALNQAVGEAGEKIVNKQSEFFQWLQGMWNSLKDMIGLTQYSWNEVKDMNLQQFTEAMAVDLLRGEELNLENEILSEGVKEVQRIAEEYKIANDIVGVQHSKVTKLFPNVSKMISEAYEQADEYSDSKEVTESYKALEEDTIKQYEFIVSKGLSVSRWKGSGEPYPNSKSMLKDVRENNHLYFLPNSEAFGKEEDSTEERLGLKPTDIYLDDGYRMTLSEVFRVVHDYFGHGILGNQFGAVREENATLQHLDLYSEKALPAVVFQTRGQNSWVNFSRVNDEALRKMKEGRETSNEELLKQGQDEFKFATPKDNILPKIFNFKTYETARRINEQEEIRKSETYLDPRGKYEDSFISDSLSRYTENSSGKLNGFSRRSLGVSKRLGHYDVDVIAEYEGNKEVERLIKNVFPQFKGTQKIYEISNGDVYREMMIEALETNKFKSSVTVHSAEDFSNMRLFVTEDGSTGITLTKDGFLGGAFGNPKADRPNNLAQMMLLGIKEGAITAEAFDTVLPNYYSMFGLKAVSRTAFNEEYRPLKVNGALEDWDYDTYYKFNKGKPDVVFFIYDGGSRETIQERIGQFDSYSRYQKDFTESYDKESYDEAYRFMEVETVNKSLYETPTIVETTKESEIFKTLSSIPLLSEDEALKAYKNIYSNKMFDWKNQEC